MTRAFRWLWKTGILSTFLTGLFALLPIMITVGIMAWGGGLLKAWLGPESFVGEALFQLGLRFVTDPTVASILGWIFVLLAIWLLGALLKSVGKKRIEKAFHAAVERIDENMFLHRSDVREGDPGPICRPAGGGGTRQRPSKSHSYNECHHPCQAGCGWPC